MTVGQIVALDQELKRRNASQGDRRPASLRDLQEWAGVPVERTRA